MNASIWGRYPHAVHTFVYPDSSEYLCPRCTTHSPGGSFALASSRPALAATSPASPESAWVLSTCTTSFRSLRVANRFHVKTIWSSSAPVITGSSTHGDASRSHSESAARTTTATSGRGRSASNVSISKTERRRDGQLRADGEHPHRSSPAGNGLSACSR